MSSSPFTRSRRRTALAGLLLLGSTWAVAAPLAPQALAPDFTLRTLDGKNLRLGEQRGRVVLVNFWATWCPSCIREMPELKRLADTFAGEAFELLTVNVGESKYKVWKFVRLVDFGLPVLLDSHKTVFSTWGMKVLPTSFLLDRNGRIRYRVQAAPQWDSEETLSVIRKLLQEQETTQ